MYSVGQKLNRARRAQGLDLAAVAARTKINAKYLELIEADDYKNLPGRFFYRSFVHQYAGFLSLDTNEIDAEIDRLLGEEAPLPLPGQESLVSRNVPPIQMVERKFDRARALKSAAALILVIGGCSGIYAWWRQSPSTKPAAVAVQSAPPGVRHDPPKPASPSPSVAAALQPPKIPSSLAAGYKVLLDLIAKETTWLQLSSDGKQVFSGVLAAHESKTVEGKEFAKMRVGNAAGIEVHLNGKLISPLGGRGQVLVVVFTRDNFQIYVPTRDGDD